MICIAMHWSLLYTRRQIRVTKVLVHENFTDSGNDIALLRLGKKDPFADQLYNLIYNQLTEEQVDLSVFSPACLPGVDENFVGQKGHVYGK